MCGIAGFIDFAHGLPGDNDRTIVAMTGSIAHRGPDGEGYWSDPAAGLWLGHRRLSIIDLSSAGSQPMWSRDGKVLVVYNGEAYNFAELRPELEASGFAFQSHCDTEVIANGIALWGMDGLCQRLVGMFAIAAWEPGRGSLTLARDRLGKKPLCWTINGAVAAFASEVSALTRHPAVSRTLDDGIAASYLRTGHVPEGQSIFSQVRKVQPGGIVEISAHNGTTTTRRYWTLEDVIARGFENPLPGGTSAALDATEELIDDAVAKRLIADVPLGAFLSGGIDSSLVVAVMQRQSRRPIQTFSIGYAEAAYDESRYAEEVAAHLGTRHRTFVLSPDDALSTIEALPRVYDEPFADASQIPTLALARKAREYVKVVLTGDGGDEVFVGYNRYLAARGLLARLDRLPGPLNRLLAFGMRAVRPAAWDRIWAAVPDRMRPRNAGEKLHKLANLLARDDWGRYAQMTSQWNDAAAVTMVAEADPYVAQRVVFDRLDDPSDRLRYLDLLNFLPGDILTKVDRATMAVGLEARSPLLDHRLLELSWRIPVATHLHCGQSKWLLRTLVQRHIPKRLIERPKTGFGVPIDTWLRGPLRDWAEELLDPVALADAGLVRPEDVREVWQRHLSGQINAQYALWTVLMYQSWYAANIVRR